MEVVSIEEPNSVLTIDGNQKAYIQWSTSGLDSDAKQIRIYHSTIDYPVVDANSAVPITESYTGDLILAGDPQLGGFLHENIENDMFHYYTVVFSDGISYTSTSVEVYAEPKASRDESSIPLLDLKSISFEQNTNQSSVNIFWDLPYNQKLVNGYFDEDFIFFAKVTDEFEGY